MRSIPADQGRRGGGGGQIPLVESEDQAHGLLFELSEVGGADITAAVVFVPCPPRAVGHLKLVVEEEREGGILAGVGSRYEQFQCLSLQLRQPGVAVLTPDPSLAARGTSAP